MERQTLWKSGVVEEGETGREREREGRQCEPVTVLAFPSYCPSIIFLTYFTEGWFNLFSFSWDLLPRMLGMFCRVSCCASLLIFEGSVCVPTTWWEKNHTKSINFIQYGFSRVVSGHGPMWRHSLVCKETKSQVSWCLFKPNQRFTIQNKILSKLSESSFIYFKAN